MDSTAILTAITIAIPAILAITTHEAAHGWVASKLGDDTALRLGRVTFNPLRHVDPVGTVVVPLVLYLTSGFAFGWAKPVPINFFRLNHPRRDMVLVAAAGPGINLALAAVSALLMAAIPGEGGAWAYWLLVALVNSVAINAVLMLFNLIPVPPLDGSRILVGLLPGVLARPFARFERFGLFALIGLLVIVPMVGRELGHDISPLGWLLGPPVEWTVQTVLTLAGHG